MLSAPIQQAGETGSVATAPSANRPDAESARKHSVFVCGKCGYGVSVTHLPPRCPICAGSDWRSPTRSRRPSEGLL